VLVFIDPPIALAHKLDGGDAVFLSAAPSTRPQPASATMAPPRFTPK
jgi:hypothetical protein